MIIKNIVGAQDEGLSLVGQTISIGGWVKSGRPAEKDQLCFLEVNDGSHPKSLQVLVRSDMCNISEIKAAGCCVVLEGEIKKSPPEAKGQVVEMHATKLKEFGKCDAKSYPLPKKKSTLEYLRSVSHMRARTNTISAVARIRNALAWATHKFFQENNFLYIHTPIITCSDCEGAGEMFQVTTLLSGAEGADAPPTPEEMAAAKAKVDEAGEAVKVAKGGEDKSMVKPAVNGLLKAKEELKGLEEKALIVGGIKRTPGGDVDYTQDFFGKKAFLTVSGQLQVETFACGLSNVYTFGPTFRAENSNTTRHLAEFWMIEPELAFADLQDDMKCAEDYVRFCCKHVLEACRADLELLQNLKYDTELIERLTLVSQSSFGRISYTEAIELLQKDIASGVAKERRGGVEFENPVEWGCDLASEHERYIAEIVYKKPTIVYNYPKDIKAFYMRLNDDNKTVAAMDVLVPKIGELIGGSQREERLDVLERRCVEMGLEPKDYHWYIDLRRYGTVTHSGFGLGFERLVLFATGIENIRDVIPFPRWPNNAEL